MKKIFLAFLLTATFGLVGCETTKPDTQVLIKKEYVVRTAPESLKSIPPYPAPIDVKTANQIDLAKWMLDNEKYLLSLESQIKSLIEFYEKPVEEAVKK